MKTTVWGLSLLVLAGGLGLAQEKPKKQLFASSDKAGLSIQVPPTGKDQLWEAKADADGGFFSGANGNIFANQIIDLVKITAVSQVLDDKHKWPDGGVKEVIKDAREGYTKPQGDNKEANFKECKIQESNDKDKFPGSLSGSCASHKLKLTDQRGGTVQIWEYFVINGQRLDRVVVQYNDESMKKHQAAILQILGSIKRFSPKKDKEKGP